MAQTPPPEGSAGCGLLVLLFLVSVVAIAFGGAILTWRAVFGG